MDRDTHTFKFADLDPELEKILNNFSSIFDIRIAYYLPDGSEYKIGSNKVISPYCLLLREVMGYRKKCLALDALKRECSKEKKCIQSYICHGGCNEVIKPIFNDEEILGYIMMGQAVSKSGIPDTVMRDAEKYGIRDEIVRSFSLLPHYERAKMNDIIQLFSELTDLVVLKNLIKHRELGAVKKVVEYMKAMDSRIDLRKAAEIAHISESRLRHRFKEELGKSFSEVKNSLCLEKAHQALLKDKELSIQEIAFRYGYADPLYFSRVFKKYFGYSPSRIR